MNTTITELLNNREILKQAQQVSSEITTILTQNGYAACLQSYIPVAACLLYGVRNSKSPFTLTVDDLKEGSLIFSEDILEYVSEAFSAETLQALASMLPKYAADIFAAAAFLPVSANKLTSSVTPDSIVKLAMSILGCKEGEHVADIGCGIGTFILSAAMSNPNALYDGYEINAGCYFVAKMRAMLLGQNVQVYLKDAFRLALEPSKKYDKIFANFPFGLRLRDLGAGKVFMQGLEEQYSGISRASSSDWVFNALVCNLLSENGKAIGITTNGSTWNSMDKLMRQYFIENGLIECVIALPGKMYAETGIPTSLIVFSHGNKGVRLIDATENCKVGRRQNEFTDEHIRIITDSMNADSEHSNVYSLEELRNNDYALHISRYRPKNFSDGVPFESVIKNITRGVTISAGDMDNLVSLEVTGIQFLKLSNIQDGVIDGELPYLSHLPGNYEKYCLKNGALVISRTGVPNSENKKANPGFSYKMAIGAVPEGQKILLNANLFSIELDTEKVNPYYLKAFFESESGIAALKSISGGATIPVLSVAALSKLEIPLPPLEDQEKVAQKYQATLAEIKLLKLKLAKAMDRLVHIFDVEKEGE